MSHNLVTDTGNDKELLEKVNSWYDPMPSFGINTYLGYASADAVEDLYRVLDVN